MFFLFYCDLTSAGEKEKKSQTHQVRETNQATKPHFQIAVSSSIFYNKDFKFFRKQAGESDKEATKVFLKHFCLICIHMQLNIEAKAIKSTKSC